MSKAITDAWLEKIQAYNQVKQFDINPQESIPFFTLGIASKFPMVQEAIMGDVYAKFLSGPVRFDTTFEFEITGGKMLTLHVAGYDNVWVNPETGKIEFIKACTYLEDCFATDLVFGSRDKEQIGKSVSFKANIIKRFLDHVAPQMRAKLLARMNPGAVFKKLSGAGNKVEIRKICETSKQTMSAQVNVLYVDRALDLDRKGWSIGGIF